MNLRSAIAICTCLLAASASAGGAAPSGTATRAVMQRKLNLRPPDITTLFTPVQIARLARISDSDVEEVNVEANRPVNVEQTTVPGGWSVVPWLFRARNTSVAPDATAANATVSHPPVFAGQMQPYDR